MMTAVAVNDAVPEYGERARSSTSIRILSHNSHHGRSSTPPVDNVITVPIPCIQAKDDEIRATTAPVMSQTPVAASFSCRRWRRLTGFGAKAPKTPIATPPSNRSASSPFVAPPPHRQPSQRPLPTPPPSWLEAVSASQVAEEEEEKAKGAGRVLAGTRNATMQWKENDSFHPQSMQQRVRRTYGTQGKSPPWQDLPPQHPKRREAERELIRDRVYLPAMHRSAKPQQQQQQQQQQQYQQLRQPKGEDHATQRTPRGTQWLGADPSLSRLDTIGAVPLGMTLLSSQLGALQQELQRYRQVYHASQGREQRDTNAMWVPRRPGSSTSTSSGASTQQRGRLHERSLLECGDAREIDDDEQDAATDEYATDQWAEGEEEEEDVTPLDAGTTSLYSFSASSEDDNDTWPSQPVKLPIRVPRHTQTRVGSGGESYSSSWSSLETHVLRALEDRHGEDTAMDASEGVKHSTHSLHAQGHVWTTTVGYESEDMSILLGSDSDYRAHQWAMSSASEQQIVSESAGEDSDSHRYDEEYDADDTTVDPDEDGVVTITSKWPGYEVFDTDTEAETPIT